MLGLATALLAAGCGGGGGESTTTQAAATLVSGTGFSFSAPAGWAATVKPTSAEARRDRETLASVIVLPLRSSYRPELYPRVVAELDRAAAALAGRLKGSVGAKRTVVAAGEKARQYDIRHAGLVDRITFVLRAKREFQLTCRWRARDGEPAACARLVSTFSFR